MGEIERRTMLGAAWAAPVVVAAAAAPAASASISRVLELTLIRDQENPEWYESEGYWLGGNGLALRNVGDEPTSDVVTVTIQAPEEYEISIERGWTIVTNTDGVLVLQTLTPLAPGEVTYEDISFRLRTRHPESISIPVVATAEGFVSASAVIHLNYPRYDGDIELDEPTYFFPLLNEPQTITGRFLPRPGAPIPAGPTVGVGWSRPGWSRSAVTVDAVTGAFSFELTWIYGEGPARLLVGASFYEVGAAELITG